MTHVLVTGGAGYIGSHACKALKAAGYQPVTYDNLVTGWADAVKFGPFEQGDLLDRHRLDEVFRIYSPVAVMHFAALSQVGEAMAEPGRYWRNNVMGSLNLIEAAVDSIKSDLQGAKTAAADLIVMGAYSRSRENETVFGGATQTVVDRAEMPILMVH